jgi:ribosomal protein L37AE/L43A
LEVADFRCLPSNYKQITPKTTNQLTGGSHASPPKEIGQQHLEAQDRSRPQDLAASKNEALLGVKQHLPERSEVGCPKCQRSMLEKLAQAARECTRDCRRSIAQAADTIRELEDDLWEKEQRIKTHGGDEFPADGISKSYTCKK